MFNKEKTKHYIKRAINKVKYTDIQGKTLCFDGFSTSYPEIKLYYSVGDKKFTNKIIYRVCDEDAFNAMEYDSWAALLTHVAFLLSPVFFKYDQFDFIKCTFGKVTKEMSDFYEFAITNMLMEFRFLQGLDPNRDIKVIGNNDKKYYETKQKQLIDKTLILNGGGKDSSLSGEIIHTMNKDACWFTVGLNEPRRLVVEQSHFEESIHLNYFLDDSIRTEGKFGYTPLASATFATTLGVLTSYMLGYRYVILSNEYSANEPNLVIGNAHVNHQFGKSFAFEERYHHFVKKHLVDDVYYFSLMRPWYELKIVEVFSNYKQYFDKFISCNIGISKNQWCKSCEKCAFILLCMAAFNDSEDLNSVFGENLFEKKKIRQHILTLTTAQTKPWECVGLKEECKLALALTLKRFPDMEFEEAPFRKDFENACQNVDIEKESLTYIHHFNNNHLLPEEFVNALKQFSSVSKSIRSND
ncbi:hypothetical protein [Colwellia sp. Bg11-28]|jgi:hypothetical protein|uniref:hypothetical protein n=1 Tax=Colwellia sp. Bg11-28 TaxID=2058305 RepID=UPI000C348690|nr:hypothetical protein [Colwellia sp. Bg11-28]PKH86068.1 hypothetical protein CXF79_22945 [Colwellia sp. Bg11-28]